jgi:hypothetical protein
MVTRKFRGAALAAAVLAAGAARAEEREARLTRAEGPVTLQAEDGEGPVALAEGQDMPLAAGDRVTTGPDGAAEIVLDGETVMDLGPGSDFTLTSLIN